MDDESSVYASSDDDDADAAADGDGAGGDNHRFPPHQQTKDANHSQVAGRAKDSPPPTPRIRGSASSSPVEGSPRLPGGSPNAATAGWAGRCIFKRWNPCWNRLELSAGN
jgi:hypothetical protein